MLHYLLDGGVQAAETVEVLFVVEFGKTNVQVDDIVVAIEIAEIMIVEDERDSYIACCSACEETIAISI